MKRCGHTCEIQSVMISSHRHDCNERERTLLPCQRDQEEAVVHLMRILIMCVGVWSTHSGLPLLFPCRTLPFFSVQLIIASDNNNNNNCVCLAFI